MSYSCSHDLSIEEIRRYSRQILVEEIGVVGQQNLRDSSLLIVGAGGLGCPVGLYTAAAGRLLFELLIGIGRIGIVDKDTVSEDNLHRQIAHCESKINTPKVYSLRDTLLKSFFSLHFYVNECLRLNSNVRIDVYNVNVTSENVLDIFKEYDIIADCTDNAPTRYLINDACVMLNKPLVWGSALRWEGQLTVYNYSKECPCYRCIFPKPPPREASTNCSESGVIGPVVGVIGNMQALETIKIAAQLKPSFSGRLFIFDGLRGDTRSIKLRPRRDDCDVCGKSPSVTQLIDYTRFCGGLTCDDKVSVFNLILCVICRRGNDSQLAVQRLRDIFKDVCSSDQIVDVKGGYQEYSQLIDQAFPVY
ncbi:unnamed protein product [Anisakis simplex]|uniref:Adenylyltransferase and sulfurtransferase MOCS3 (inferred by orthology to a C. elegans protein) n=1 Tax=Anisakis simplex TaxID=6269 RepID=A0A0M3JU04_ANISI|nr:unnamed protein product [Anisakis simplex]